jgi:hypothetical protein
VVRTRALATAFLAAAAVLTAGCAGGDGGDDLAAQASLAAGKGAIQGLLVDDRYRPIHLTDKPAGEFDASGFILVVETGATVTTGPDGVFQVLDLEPGTYTLKPSVEGHEGAPAKVDVSAGKYTEVDLLVRRLLTLAKNPIAVHDDTLLITCSMQVTNGHLNFGRLCHGDLAASEEGNAVDYNYTDFGEAAALVVEIEFSKVGDYEFWLSRQLDVVQLEGDLYRKVFGFGTDYMRFSALNGTSGEGWDAPLNMKDLRIWVNVNGVGSEQTYDASGYAFGADFTFAVKARLVVSAFLEVPADLDTYALLR